MIDWDTCKKDFGWDGSWRDIYIKNATLADWRKLYASLREYPGVEYFIDKKPTQMPPSIDDVFATRQFAGPDLRLKAGKVVVACHFFTSEEIEFDIDPREVSSQTDFDSILNFIKAIGDVVGKLAVLTPENVSDMPIISYNPENKEFFHHESEA